MSSSTSGAAKNIGDIAGDDVGALVVDVGSHTTRVGYAGEDCPKQLWSSCVGLPRHLTDDCAVQQLMFPLNFHVKKEYLEVKPCYYPNGASQAMNAEVFERIIDVTCQGEESTRIGGLGIDLIEHPVLLTEPSKHNRVIREKMVEILFERFQVPAAYLVKRAVLSSFAVGRASGLVVDIGASGVSNVPVWDGFSLQKNILEYPVGGDLLDEQLALLLAEKRYVVNPTYGVKKTMRDIGKPISIQKCDMTGVHPSYLNSSRREVIRNLKESLCRCAEDDQDIANTVNLWSNNLAFSGPSSSVPPSLPLSSSRPCSSLGVFHELPDGTRVEGDALMYGIPEMLFKPSLLIRSRNPACLRGFKGLPVGIAECIQSCDVDVRRDLLGAIIITGGGSLIPGLSDRICRSLQEDETLLGGATRFKIVAPSTAVERRFSSWIGGSILASLGSFQQMWFSLEEYREHGTQLAERKCA